MQQTLSPQTVTNAYVRLIAARLRADPNHCPKCDRKLILYARNAWVCPDGCWSGEKPNSKLNERTDLNGPA